MRTAGAFLLPRIPPRRTMVRMDPRSLPENVAVCKLCKKPISWENLKWSEREIQPRVFERAYICPHCRAVLEFASWQTGVSRKD